MDMTQDIASTPKRGDGVSAANASTPTDPTATKHDATGSDTAVRRRATIYDVAARVGVSYATVSRYLNGHSGVSARTGERIRRVIEELDFTPSSAAQALSSRRTRLIALIVHGEPDDLLDDPNIMRIMASANKRIAEEHWQMVTMLANSDEEIDAIARRIASGFADGYLLFTLKRRDPILDAVRRLGVPAVVSGTGFGEPLPCPSVDVDNDSAMAALTRHVLESGRRRPAFVSGPLDMPGAPERLRAFRTAVDAALPDYAAPIFQADDWKRTSGRAAVFQWRREGLLPEETGGFPAAGADGGNGMSGESGESGESEAGGLSGTGRPPIDAILCANDTLAAGAVETLQGLGLRVPDDVAVTGFDNSTAALSVDPPLTTVDQHMDLKGRTMADTVIRTIRGESSPAVIDVPFRLVIRRSA